MKMSIIRKGVILVACLTAMGAWTAPSKAASQSFKVTLNGAQQVPPVQTAATGTAELTYDPATRVLTWTLNYSGLSGPATMAHFHGPAAQGKNGPPVIWLAARGIFRAVGAGDSRLRWLLGARWGGSTANPDGDILFPSSGVCP